MSVAKLPAIPNIRIKDNETSKAVTELNNSLKPAVKFVNESKPTIDYVNNSKATIDDVKSNMPQLKELVALLPDIKDIINSDFNKRKEISITFATAEEKTVAHNLGKTPSGFIIIDVDASNPVSFSRTTFDATNIIMKSSDAATIKIWVF